MPEEQPDTAHMPVRNSTKGRWRHLIAVLMTGLVILLGGQAIGVLVTALLAPVASPVEALIPDIADGTVVNRFATVFAIEAVTILLVWHLLHRGKLRFSSIGLTKPKWVDLGAGLAGFALYLPFFLILASVLSILIPGLDDGKQALGFDDADKSIELVLVFLSLVVLPPIVEEILFRGFVFTSLRAKYAFTSAAIWTSLVFAAPHLFGGNSGEPLLWMAFIDTFVLSLGLVYLRERTGRLWAPIILHALKNGTAFVALFFLNNN